MSSSSSSSPPPPNNNNNNKRSVLIVGAGPSGLVALKEMLEAGHEAMAVDASGECGGVFAPHSNVTYEGLHLTISNMFMAYSDFPPKDAQVKYWSKDEYYDYLVDYVRHFDLQRHIQFYTRVEHAALDAAQKWQVQLKHKDSYLTKSASFDYLIVATGANHYPKIPPVFDGFQGQVLHSAQYHSGEQVRGKRVLVVGTGESASDVARSAGETAQHVSVWGRRYPDIAPRFPHDYANEPHMDEHKRLAHQDGNLLPADCLETYTTSRIVRNMPLFLVALCAQLLQKVVRWFHGRTSAQGLCCEFTDVCWSYDYFSADTAMVPTKSAILLCTAAQRKCEVIIAPSIACHDGSHKVTFHNPSYRGFEPIPSNKNNMKSHSLDMEFDVIVACTGYKIQYDWISTPHVETTSCPRTWFKHCFPPNLGEHMAYLGLARPQQGGIPQCSEILARFIAQLIKPSNANNSIQLPPNYAELAKWEGNCERACYHIQPEFELLMDYQAFMMSVAKMLRVTPVCPTLQESESFASWADTVVKHWTFPLWPCFFRTQGVGANPQACQRVLNKFGPYDALPESPLFLISQLLCTFVMPIVNLVSYVLNPILNLGKTSALPRAYQWRMSVVHILYFNSFTWHDCFQFVPYQWIAGIMVMAHVLKGVIKMMLFDPPRNLLETHSLLKKTKQL